MTYVIGRRFTFSRRITWTAYRPGINARGFTVILIQSRSS